MELLVASINATGLQPDLPAGRFIKRKFKIPFTFSVAYAHFAVTQTTRNQQLQSLINQSSNLA